MNSKEALQNIRDYRIEIVKKLDIIEEDLELLDIIKVLIKKGDIVVNSDLFVDYPELYEWLEQNGR